MSTYKKDELGQESDEFYESLNKMIQEMCKYAPHPISALANVCSLVNDQLPRLNWAGFYLNDGKKLILGPFQGKPACTEISMGSGVCGTAAHEKKVITVDDVAVFPGHIACDSESQSELVAPLLASDGEVVGVLDLDSPEKGRFDEVSKKGFEKIAFTISRYLDGKSVL